MACKDDISYMYITQLTDFSVTLIVGIGLKLKDIKHLLVFFQQKFLMLTLISSIMIFTARC